jgi:hypothetical protein
MMTDAFCCPWPPSVHKSWDVYFSAIESGLTEVRPIAYGTLASPMIMMMMTMMMMMTGSLCAGPGPPAVHPSLLRGGAG